ncbi:MAG TPA: DNA polymerase III subunit delta' [Acetobacteraceae bacterium]|nr:DNA polymerase III subunit delta' [Acetobacteraceae bacterium]
MPAPDPRANPFLIGHEAAEAAVLEAMRAGRLHHAWLIEGPEGVGKATLAFRFARHLLAGKPAAPSLALDPANPVFRRVAAGGHADLIVIERTYDAARKRMRRVIQVEDVRRISAFMGLTPAEGGWRVVIVDGAEDLNPPAFNALLKILEEPPSRAILLLTCAAPGRLPPTIHSRCRHLRLHPLSDAAMATALARYLPELDEAARGRLIALADGSPGRALLLAEEDGIALAELVDAVLWQLPELPPARGYEIADRLGRTEDAFGTFMDLLRATIAAAVRAQARGRADPEQARLASLRPLDAWGDVWQALTRLQDETERFALDKRQAILTGLEMLRQPLPGTR